jgi:hypothetical protein
MTEEKAIELALELARKHIIPADVREDRETPIIQVIADMYGLGYEIVPVKRELKLGDSISREDVAQMLRDKVAY